MFKNKIKILFIFVMLFSIASIGKVEALSAPVKMNGLETITNTVNGTPYSYSIQKMTITGYGDAFCTNPHKDYPGGGEKYTEQINDTKDPFCTKCDMTCTYYEAQDRGMSIAQTQLAIWYVNGGQAGYYPPCRDCLKQYHISQYISPSVMAKIKEIQKVCTSGRPQSNYRGPELSISKVGTLTETEDKSKYYIDFTISATRINSWTCGGTVKSKGTNTALTDISSSASWTKPNATTCRMTIAKSKLKGCELTVTADKITGSGPEQRGRWWWYDGDHQPLGTFYKTNVPVTAKAKGATPSIPCTKITFAKKDSDTKAAINGGSFELYTNNTCTTKATDITGATTAALQAVTQAADTYHEARTGSNYWVNLPTKTSTGANINYYVKEVTPPTNYDAPSSKCIPVSNGGTGTFSNRRKPITIIKKDESGNKIPLAAFNIYTNASCTEFAKIATASNMNAQNIYLVDSYGGEQKFYLDPIQSLYYVKEVIAPPGYIISETACRQVAINGSISFNDYPNKITITKVDAASTSTKVNGGTYRLYTGSTCASGTEAKDVTGATLPAKKAESNGQVVFEKLEAKTYYVKETIAPPGYALPTENNNCKPVVLSANSNAAVTIKNQKNYVRFTKKDSDTGNIVTGGTYRLYTNSSCSSGYLARNAVSNTTYGTFTLNTTATTGFKIEGMASGSTYYIKEETAPPGYALPTSANNCVKLTLNSDTVIGTVYNKQNYITIVKKDSDTQTAVTGGRYKLFTDATCATEAKTAAGVAFGEKEMTATTGITLKGMASGVSYYVKETKAPTGYTLPTESNNCKPAALNATVTITNKKNKITIKKIDSDTNTVVGGGIYRLYTDQSCQTPSSLGQLTANANTGIVEFQGMADGTYYVKEEKAPDGYALPTENNNCKPAALNGETVIKNKKNYIKITKRDKNGSAPLADATYQLYTDSACSAGKEAKDADGKAIAPQKTLADGTVTFSGMATGTYYYKETVPPPGYNSPTGSNCASATLNSLTANVVYNEKTMLTVKKIDSDTRAAVGEGKYKLFTNSNCTAASEAVDEKTQAKLGEKQAGADGTVTFSGMKAGVKYYAKETVAPPGYALPSGKNCHEVSVGGTVTIVNTKNVIEVTKEDMDGNTLTGGKYRIYTDATCTTIAKDGNGQDIPEKTMDTDNGITFSGMASTSTTFYIKETKAPNGFKLPTENNNCKPVNINGTAVIKNEPTTITIVKTDSDTNTVLKGAKYKLFTNDSCIIVAKNAYTNEDLPEKTTGDDGKAIFENVAETGTTYYVKETGQPDGYAPPVGDNCEQVGVGTSKTIKNKKNYILIIKEDKDTRERLEGATYQLYTNKTCKAGTEALNELTSPKVKFEPKSTEANGTVKFEGISSSIKYYIREVGQPDGYAPPEGTNCLEAKINNDTDNLIKNSKNIVTVLKVNGSDEALNGGKYRLYTDPECKTIAKTASDAEVPEMEATAGGSVSFTQLPAGTTDYYVKETVPPAGYSLPEDNCAAVKINGKVKIIDSLNYVQVLKKDIDTDEVVGGGKYRLYTNPGCTTEATSSITKKAFGEKTADETGEVKFEGVLDSRDYYIKETTPPPGYAAPEGSNCEKANINEPTEIKNKLNGIEVTKRDSDTNEMLKNAKYLLYNDDKCTEVATNQITKQAMQIVTTNDRGVARFEGVLSGKTYYVKEEEAPAGYKDPTTNCLEATAGSTVQFKNQKGAVEVLKVDLKTQSPLAGAVYGLYTDNECKVYAKDATTGNDLATITTKDDGKATFNNIAKAQSYYVKEITPPSGYYDLTQGNCRLVSNQTESGLKFENNQVICKEYNGKFYDNEGKEVANKAAMDKACNGKCVKDGDKYYDNNGQEVTETEYYQQCKGVCYYDEEDKTYYGENSLPVTEAEYNYQCSPYCTEEDGKYYGNKRDFKEVTREEYEAQCNPTCVADGDKYYDDKGREVSQEDYMRACDKKCRIDGNNYYDETGRKVSQEEYYESCNPKCEQDEQGQYYDYNGKPVTEDEYNASCNDKCVYENGKYYDRGGKVVSESDYYKSCKNPCSIVGDKYLNDKKEVVSEAEYYAVCNPKCEYRNGKYYDNNNRVTDENGYIESCIKECSIVDGKYYGKDKKVVSQEEYDASCNPTCQIKDGKYYNDKGKEVSEARYYEVCNPKCQETVDGKYYGDSGQPVTEEEFLYQCRSKCAEEDGIYYNEQGIEITEKEFYAQCNPKCQKVGDKYFNNTGKPVNEKDYYNSCNPKCEAADGKYYDSKGEPVTKATFEKNCNPKCSTKDGKYYDNTGAEVTQAVYNQKCVKNVVTVPDTGSIVSVVGTIAGTGLIAAGGYTLFRRYKPSKKS